MTCKPDGSNEHKGDSYHDVSNDHKDDCNHDDSNEHQSKEDENPTIIKGGPYPLKPHLPTTRKQDKTTKINQQDYTPNFGENQDV